MAALRAARDSEGCVKFRLIVHPRMEGRLDMAVDEALAEAVGAGASLPVVRLYGFSPPTLSLGRFQKIKGRYSPALLAQGQTLTGLRTLMSTQPASIRQLSDRGLSAEKEAR